MLPSVSFKGLAHFYREKHVDVVYREYPQEIARDYHANWMTATEMLSDDVYIGGEADCNIFTLRRNAGLGKPTNMV